MRVLPFIYLRAAARFEHTITQIRHALERMCVDLGDTPAPETSGTRGTLALLLLQQRDRASAPHGHARFVEETARFAHFSALGRLAEIALAVEGAAA